MTSFFSLIGEFFFSYDHKFDLIGLSN